MTFLSRSLLAVVLCSLSLGCVADSAEQRIADEAVRVTGRHVHSDAGWQASWPGVYWQLAFSGQALGVQLNDAKNYYRLQVGARSMLIAPQAGSRTVWLADLPAGEHQATLTKLTESPRDIGTVEGFWLNDGQALATPAARTRQIEFIGDSYTAALGNLSRTRECSDAEIWANTDVSQGYAVLSAQAFAADWQTNAMSGMGLLRNWNGNQADEDFRTFYPRQLQPLAQDDALSAPDWQPQLVVVGLGANDFSTPVREGEARSQQQLNDDFLLHYRELLTQLRTRYNNPAIILTSTYLWPDDRQRPLIRQLASEERAAGRAIAVVEWPSPELTGCAWHPSLNDHQRMSAQLNAAIRGLLPGW